MSAAATVYDRDNPQIADQEAWVSSHQLEDARDYFTDFRDYVNTGDLDPMITLFMDVLIDRKNVLSKHQTTDDLGETMEAHR